MLVSWRLPLGQRSPPDLSSRFFPSPVLCFTWPRSAVVLLGPVAIVLLRLTGDGRVLARVKLVLLAATSVSVPPLPVRSAGLSQGGTRWELASCWE